MHDYGTEIDWKLVSRSFRIFTLLVALATQGNSYSNLAAQAPAGESDEAVKRLYDRRATDNKALCASIMGNAPNRPMEALTLEMITSKCDPAHGISFHLSCSAEAGIKDNIIPLCVSMSSRARNHLAQYLKLNKPTAPKGAYRIVGIVERGELYIVPLHTKDPIARSSCTTKPEQSFILLEISSIVNF